MKLFDFQEKGVADLVSGFKQHRVQCLAWYTGAGKTNVFMEFSKRLIKENPKVKIGISAYITSEIKEQVYERCMSFGLRDVSHMVMPCEVVPTNKNLYIFNPQTMYLNPPKLSFDYFIIDEGHVAVHTDCLMIKKIRDCCTTKNTKILISSATPWDTLALDEFKGMPVFKRPLDSGIKDGLITDFKFYAEEALITFSDKDFSRSGDLGLKAQQREMALLKSSCLGKFEYLLSKYDKEIGKKCVVICPPGNFAEVARTLNEKFGGSLFIQQKHLERQGRSTHRVNNRKILAEFKQGKSRFLFVVNKCSVGFDMKNLSSVIDLTMSRNITVLAQRCGRVARKNGDQLKHYFYVYDQSLMKDRLEWLVSTMIDFCLGSYDGWTTQSVKYRNSGGAISWSRRSPTAVLLSEIVKALRDDELIENRKTMSWLTSSGPPTKWTLVRAKEKAKEFSSRTEMWSKCPALYKWFRLNNKAEMDQIFPLKLKLNQWNNETIEALMKEHTEKMGRREFLQTFRGISYWLEKNRETKRKLLDKYFPRSVREAWTDDAAIDELIRLKKWRDIRKVGGLRGWMIRNGKENYWKNVWLNLTPKQAEKEPVATKTNEPIIYEKPIALKARPKEDKTEPVSAERKKLQEALAKYRDERDALRKRRRSV